MEFGWIGTLESDILKTPRKLSKEEDEEENFQRDLLKDDDDLFLKELGTFLDSGSKTT